VCVAYNRVDRITAFPGRFTGNQKNGGGEGEERKRIVIEPVTKRDFPITAIITAAHCPISFE